MLHIILVEAALEMVPPEITSHPSVRRNAKRQGKRPDELLLNRSLHHYAMKKLPDSNRRGRPDIVQICLLEGLGTPLNKLGSLRIWIHTVGGYAIDILPNVRVPRDCNRFNSLMEQLFLKGEVPPGRAKPLMRLYKTSLSGLLKRISPSYTVALTSHGKPVSLEGLCKVLSLQENPVVFIGAFPQGSMSVRTLTLADEALSIHQEPLEAWVVTSRLIYEYEKLEIEKT